MNIIIVNPRNIVNRITEFYNNAKTEKHDNSYGWDEVRKDILVARKDTNFTPYNSSKQDWINAQYKVVINKRGWAFAYLIEGNNMYIYDVDNYRYLNIPIDDTKDLNLYRQLKSVKPKQVQPYSSLGYGWWFTRHEDGYIYLHDRNGNMMPNIRFNEIVSKFRKRKDDANVYAVGQYGGKNFKLYPNGRCVMMENRKILRLTEYQFKTLLTECITKILKEIA